MNDNEINAFMQQELERQQTTLALIPSENYASPAVLKASSSVFANKYAEGYPRKRYYQGNSVVDGVEETAIARAKALFGAEHVNVQPHSGAPANQAVYFALLQPGEKVLAMNLAHGGHLTHGSGVNFSGKTYRFIPYGVDQKTERIDMDAIRKIALEEQPKIILSGFTAYPRTVDFKAFHEIAQEIGAYSMADISHIAGLVAAGTHPSPFPFTDIVTTTTHKTLRGPRGAVIFSKQQDRLKEKFDPLGKKDLAQKIDAAVFPGLQGGPHLHTIAAKAVAFHEASQAEFKDYAQQIVRNAKALAQELMDQGIKLVSDGTDNHLILIDLSKTKAVAKPGMGRTIATALETAGMVANANSIPFDLSSPFTPSGLRIGTAALTTRGMKEAQMQEIGKMMSMIIGNHDNISLRESVKEKVQELCRQFPIYEEEN